MTIEPYLTTEEKAPELSEGEKKIRDAFVVECMKGFDPFSACIRIGYNKTFAQHFSELFMTEPYTLRRLQEATTAQHTQIEDAESEKVMKREVVSALRKEMHYHGPGSTQAARVAAATKLASLLDMEPAKKIDLNHGVVGGVMKVPRIANVEDWENEAIESQKKLVTDVRLN